VDIVSTADGETEGETEVEVCGGAGVQIQGDDGARVGVDCLELDGVHEGLGQSGELQRSVIETIHVVPDYELSAYFDSFVMED
jgi:hypothetical protein